ncbi:LuxS/MPP-like metallohydrolase [Exidia glandulosa HHB12029]|uniref:LuxS/MPP-like metallohydrolase n=1 Tax=Exidia glandulosa HHB12029 TaxID=1314781 RepID=A0A165NAL4_EXIGL|nr:LuxS/MPP-like metallohydrolase [Exidia glandulosa HHB12029]
MKAARAGALTRRALSTALEPQFQVTTLPNKLRVATQNAPGHFASVGVFVDTGPRYEHAATLGASHFLDRLAYKSTRNRSADDMMTAIDRIGGQIVSSSSRESIMYQSSHFPQHTARAVELLADAALNPALTEEEIDAQRDPSLWELRELTSKPDAYLPETLHAVAFHENTLGHPLLCTEDRIDSMDRATLANFHATWYRPERMVLAGAGVPHEELLELAHKHFGHLLHTPLPAELPLSSEQIAAGAGAGSPRVSSAAAPLVSSNGSSSSVYKTLSRAASSYLYPSLFEQNTPASTSYTPSFRELATQPSRYTGGHRYVADSESDFNHVYLAFLGPPLKSPKVYAMATLQILLGGGGAFSAGGPGKGMYSRLYTHILNRHAQVEHCASFQHIYSDASLFGLFATFSPTAGSSVVLSHLANQLSLLLRAPVPQPELQRAKNQLMSGLVMALESRAVEVEDLGRQLLLQENRVPLEEMCARIRAVTADDLKEVAGEMFGSSAAGRLPTVVVYGREDVRDWRETLYAYGVGA